MRTTRSLLLVLALGAWAGFSVAAFGRLLEYKSRPGLREATGDWPPNAGMPAPSGASVLLVFLHPRCPCSGATLSELERLCARARGLDDLRIVMFAPASGSEAWAGSGVERRAASLAGARIVHDSGGRIARRFGVRTSGAVRLFGPDGRLWFAGGITPARGHEGDSDGQRAVLESLRDRAPSRLSAPVYGCGIFGDAPVCNGEGPCPNLP